MKKSMLMIAIVVITFAVTAQTAKKESNEKNKIETKSLNSPDLTTTPFEKMKVETVTVGGVTLQRVTFYPGWKWSENNKPSVKTDYCTKHHLMYILSGKLKIVTNDGTKAELVTGDYTVVEPGHDAWVIGDEPAVVLEMETIRNPVK